MSFTADVKREISLNELKPCCIKGELSALIQLCSTLSISNQGLMLKIKTENAAIAKRIWTMIKTSYDVECELSVMRKMNLKKNNVYYIKVLNKARYILEDLGLFSSRGLLDRPLKSVVTKECCARAYLAGAFMATGSVNTPLKTNYHLEIKTISAEHAQFILELMERFNLPAKIIKRRNNQVVYLKAADKIADFLKCIGSNAGLMKFEDIRITRDFKNSLTRLGNCEVANEVKSQKAAHNQLQDIKIIEQFSDLRYVDHKLIEVIKLRKQYEEASLLELCNYYASDYQKQISKSGMKHRFTKIHDLAEKLKKEN